MPGANAGRFSQHTNCLNNAGFASIDSHADIPGAMPGTTLIVAEKK